MSILFHCGIEIYIDLFTDKWNDLYVTSMRKNFWMKLNDKNEKWPWIFQKRKIHMSTNYNKSYEAYQWSGNFRKINSFVQDIAQPL